jgi:hypothetical protein
MLIRQRQPISPESPAVRVHVSEKSDTRVLSQTLVSRTRPGPPKNCPQPQRRLAHVLVHYPLSAYMLETCASRVLSDKVGRTPWPDCNFSQTIPIARCLLPGLLQLLLSESGLVRASFETRTKRAICKPWLVAPVHAERRSQQCT